MSDPSSINGMSIATFGFLSVRVWGWKLENFKRLQHVNIATFNIVDRYDHHLKNDKTKIY